MQRNKHKRNWECVAVVHWLFHRVVAPKGAVCVFECLSANLALQEFFQAINFRLLPSWQICQLHYQAPVLHEVFHLLQVSKHLYTSGIPKQLSRKAQTPPNIYRLATKHLFVIFQCRRNFNFMVCFVVIILKNRIKRAF